MGLNFLRRRKQIDLEDYLAAYNDKLRQRGLNEDGTAVLDPTPIAPPIGYKKAPSMVEVIRNMVTSERLAQAARESGHETFEESEDFDVGDEPDQLASPWENDFDPPISELVKAGEEAVKEREKAAVKRAGEVGGGGGTPPPEGGGTPPEPSKKA